MAEKMTAEQYNNYQKQLSSGEIDLLDLTDEERTALKEYERAAYGIPSEEDIHTATQIINSYDKDPSFHGGYTAEDRKWASSIYNQAQTGRRLMINEGKDPWIRKVKEVPDDVIKDYGFKFNWKSAYENEKGEKLRPTERDAEKLRSYIDEKMYDVNDNVDLLKIAYDMHMTGQTDEDPDHTNMWTNFMQSDRFPEFQKYIKDVEKFQRDKAIDEIFDGDGGFSDALVNWMLPVSKEHAKKSLKEGKEPHMGGPLTADFLTQAFMFSPGKEFIKRPLISTVYGTTMAPLAMETGNYLFNDKPLADAAVGTLEGTMINAAPIGIGKLQNIGAGAVARNGVGSFTAKQQIQKTINEAADAADKVRMLQKKGYTWSHDGKNYVLKKGQNVLSDQNGQAIKFSKNRKGEFVPVEISADEAITKTFISDADYKAAQGGESRIKKIFGSRDKNVAKVQKGVDKDLKTIADMSKTDAKQVILDKVRKGQKLTIDDLSAAGINNKETLYNFLKRNMGKAELSTSYLQNVLGRPEFGRRAGASVLNAWMPDIDLFKKKEDREKGTDKWYRYYGLK